VITLDLIIAVALRHEHVMEQLGAALTNDLVVANPFQRRCAELAIRFLQQYRKLPASGDWQLWLETLEAGMMRDGTKEALGRLLAIDTSGYDPVYFAETTRPILEEAAAQIARARLNETQTVAPGAFAEIADKIGKIGVPVAARQNLFPTLGEVITEARTVGADDAAEELIPRLAWLGRHVLLSAAPKLGKSTFVAAGAAALTRGWRFLDGVAGVCEVIDSESGEVDPEMRMPGRVLWLAMDESLGDAVPRLLDNGALPMRCVVMNPEAPDKLLARVLSDPTNRPDLVVIDSLIEYARRVSSEMPSSGDAGAWGQVMRPLTDFAHRYKVGIVTIHHARKSDGGFRDSGEIKAAVDAIIEMREPGGKQDDATRNMTFEARRSIRARSDRFSIRLTAEVVEIPMPEGRTASVRRDIYQLGGGDAAAQSEEAKPDVEAKIVEFVRKNPGCSQQAIFDVVGDRRREVTALAEQNKLLKVTTGRGFAFFPPQSESPQES